MYDIKCIYTLWSNECVCFIWLHSCIVCAQLCALETRIGWIFIAKYMYALHSLSFECDHAGAYIYIFACFININYVIHFINDRYQNVVHTLTVHKIESRSEENYWNLKPNSQLQCDVNLRNSNFMLNTHTFYLKKKKTNAIRQNNEQNQQSAMSLSSQHHCLHQNEFLNCYALQINKLNWVQSTNE